MRAIKLTLREISLKFIKAQAAVQGNRLLFFSILLFILLPQLAEAQRSGRAQERKLTAPDTLQVPPVIQNDTLAIPSDTLALQDSAKIVPSSPILSEITYFAED
ncbi:MAG TPA: hypothetical protein DCL81_00235, partial [Algoriphagus sp.]|nr:hypothetical protein [Algoriphagus sp.]